MTNQRISMNLPGKDYPLQTALKPRVKNWSRTPDTELGVKLVWYAFLASCAITGGIVAVVEIFFW
jgi:hypothetical protein